MKMALLGLLLLIAGGITGFILAVASFRMEVWLDYDSGDLMNCYKIGFVEMRRERVGSNQFAVQVLPSGTLGITGKPRWERAFVFQGKSPISQGFQAGEAVNLITRLNSFLPYVSNQEAAEVKEAFLIRLALGRINEVTDLVSKVEKRAVPRSER